MSNTSIPTIDYGKVVQPHIMVKRRDYRAENARREASRGPWCATLAKHVRSDREAWRMSLTEYGQLLGVSRMTITRVEQGQGCDVSNLIILQRRLALSFDMLLGAIDVK